METPSFGLRRRVYLSSPHSLSRQRRLIPVGASVMLMSSLIQGSLQPEAREKRCQWAKQLLETPPVH